MHTCNIYRVLSPSDDCPLYPAYPLTVSIASCSTGQKESRPGEQLAHNFSGMVQHLIDLPLKYESFSVLSIAHKDSGFLATELAMAISTSSFAVVVWIVGVSPVVSTSSSSVWWPLLEVLSGALSAKEASSWRVASGRS
jgi:hypothetical protein